MRRFAFLLIALLVAAAPAAVAQKDKKKRGQGPETIALPTGWAPEGIAKGPGNTIFVGSIPTGAVWAGNVKTGEGAPRVPAREGRAAIGLKYDSPTKRLFVAGGPTGSLFVYNARSGADVARHDVAGGFVNDVAIAGKRAYFTDSRRPVLYALRTRGRLGPRTIPLTGAMQYVDGFNANGIAAAKDGKVLIVVQGNVGKLFTVSPRTGRTREIDLRGATVPNGDGLLLNGRTLYVVQNQLNKIAVVRLAKNLRSGRVVREITDPDFNVPTTLARVNGRLYAPNAKFGTPPAGTPYEVVKVG